MTRNNEKLHQRAGRESLMIKILIVTTLCLSSCASILGQSRRVDAPISDELHQITLKYNDAIRSENEKDPQNEWAGVYLQGDHHPTVFAWAPKSGFLITSSLHTFSPSWVNYGKVTFTDNLISVEPTLTESDVSAHIMPTQFVPIRWDKWHYLVPPHRLVDFAYAVHSNSEYQLGNFFVRDADSRLPRKGLPNLPPELHKYMKMPAIKARILEIEGNQDDIWKLNLTIDVGTDDLVIPGMEFYLLGKKGTTAKLRVDKVGKESSTALLSGIGRSGDSEADLVPKLGWRFSSKAPKDLVEP